MTGSAIELKCECKNDPWGKKGSDSFAGRLWSQNSGNSESLKDSETYSEMWMGTYPSLESRLASDDTLLSDHLKSHPELLGKAFCRKYSTDIPFLPKILSFAKALPLQLHPDKKLAEKLHAENPDKFADANHKPEIAVALTKFELFVGFKSFEDLEEVFALKALEDILPKREKLNDEVLRETCHTLLKLSPEKVSDIVSKLKQISPSELRRNHQVPELLERLSQQYSEFDNGNLVAALLMNYMVLKPGEAVCVPADSIHAWLSGDILECMARSDNVLNTGFCPRADRDNIDLFTRALTFNPQSRVSALLPAQSSPVGWNQRTCEFAPPFNEFNVLGLSLAAGEVETHVALEGPSLLVVTQGAGEMKIQGEDKSLRLHEGSVYFVATKVQLQFSTQKELKLYRAYAVV
ncbi:hypothetical protein N7456_009358 [Penicillium angulare]|uniref:Mannose-6-phosphate isomerase n=1 Tax=Penicillium angulare TaxID=116970 RepID=A0A9W9K624_9EURO|nr:hypothetical protein N7456_009358 [Penicillium angulare]